MDFMNKNIINFYKNNQNNSYLLDNFTKTKKMGRFTPYEKNLFKTDITKNIDQLTAIDDHNDYYINEFGFRGKIDIDSDIIGAGCSFTFGSGVPENGRWTNILSKKINNSIVNLASPGYSIPKICNVIINYSTKYKMPKKIFCLFPGFFRTMLIQDSDFYVSVRTYSLERAGSFEIKTITPSIKFSAIDNLILYENSKKNSHLNKKNMEDVLSPHQYILDCVDAISMLESFCLFNNIELIWTTWESATSCLMDTMLEIPNFKLNKYNKLMKDSYDNYLGEYAEFPKKFCDKDHNSEFANHYCWNQGSDYHIDNKYKRLEQFAAHPGIHYHEHISDFFYELIDK